MEYKKQPRTGSLIREHTAVAERVLGKPLPNGAEIHHLDGNKLNNSNDNLVICQDRAYHMLLEIRTRALKAAGNPNWRKCKYCQTWDAVENLSPYSFSGYTYYYHKSCPNRKNKHLSKGELTNA